MRNLEDELEPLLIDIFGSENVKRNWDVAKEAEDLYNRRELYTPRLDFAIGPFNVTTSVRENLRRIDASYRLYKSLVMDLEKKGVM